MAERRVIVVGAGPAGVRAAQALVAAGVRPLVIDEGCRDGGQIYRRQPEGFTRSYETLYGTEAARARGVHETFDRLRPAIDYEPETLVWNVSEGAVWTHCNGTARAVPYSALILCSGATDRLVPVKGWNRSGCYSLGGAQIALKAQACAIGHKVVFLGTGPLLYLVAHQYAKAGADVVAVLDTSLLAARIAATLRLAVQPDLLWTGAKLTFDMKRRGISLLSGVDPVEIHGTDAGGVTGISVRCSNGAIRHFECDAVGMGWHLRPETQLADLARCRFVFDETTRQWLPEADEDGRASAENVYLAGDGARILGARCAEVTGELAALTALKDLGIADEADRRRAGAGDRHGQYGQGGSPQTVGEDAAGQAAERPDRDGGEGRQLGGDGRRLRRQGAGEAGMQEDADPRPHGIQLPHVAEIAEIGQHEFALAKNFADVFPIETRRG